MNHESALVEHSVKENKGAPLSFQMEVVAFPNSNLVRQALEATVIQSKWDQTLLKRKGEWGHNLSSNLLIEADKEKGTGPQKRKCGSQRPDNKKECLLFYPSY